MIGTKPEHLDGHVGRAARARVGVVRLECAGASVVRLPISRNGNPSAAVHYTRRHDTRRHDTRRHDTRRHDKRRHDTRRHDTRRHDTRRHDSRRQAQHAHVCSSQGLRNAVPCYYEEKFLEKGFCQKKHTVSVLF